MVNDECQSPKFGYYHSEFQHDCRTFRNIFTVTSQFKLLDFDSYFLVSKTFSQIPWKWRILMFQHFFEMEQNLQMKKMEFDIFGSFWVLLSKFRILWVLTRWLLFKNWSLKRMRNHSHKISNQMPRKTSRSKTKICDVLEWTRPAGEKHVDTTHTGEVGALRNRHHCHNGSIPWKVLRKALLEKLFKFLHASKSKVSFFFCREVWK